MAPLLQVLRQSRWERAGIGLWFGIQKETVEAKYLEMRTPDHCRPGDQLAQRNLLLLKASPSQENHLKTLLQPWTEDSSWAYLDHAKMSGSSDDVYEGSKGHLLVMDEELR
jgi:hypothetical protein